MTQGTLLTKAVKAVEQEYKGVQVYKASVMETSNKGINVISGIVLVEFKVINVVDYNGSKYYEVYVRVNSTSNIVVDSTPKEV